jgi:cyclopropane fatty-acyl-phospholipid synthase-like methyltransferase
MTYDESYYCVNGQVNDRPALWYYERLAKKYFSPGRVLDFGSGTGFLLRRLARHFQADGYEISAFARQSSRKLLGGINIYSELAEIPGSSYSGITALHVFEHIGDRDLSTIVSALRNLLLPGGRMLCVMPELHGRGNRLKNDNWAGFRDKTHVNLKTAGEWQTFFQQEGFSVVEMGTDGLWDFPYSTMPLVLDRICYGGPTCLQFLTGRLVLPVSAGESLIMIVQRSSN